MGMLVGVGGVCGIFLKFGDMVWIRISEIGELINLIVWEVLFDSYGKD